jgi:hypothetical protein
VIRSEGDSRADLYALVLREIEAMIPLNADGSADSYDGTANPVILALVRKALKHAD